ncbi:MAG: Hsp20/alpha crystallin family protein [Pyrinomonadaceae bacterium]
MSQSRPIMMPVSCIRVDAEELKRIEQRMKELFAALEEAHEMRLAESSSFYSPKIDISETSNDIRISVELPGVSQEDVDIFLTPHEVLIEGVKKQVKETTPASTHYCCERRFGRFKRTIKLHWTININESDADLRNGTLTIRIPKLADRRGNKVRIPIKEGI